MKGNQPYISFVVVARNDNYGGDFLDRMTLSVRCLLELCDTYSLDSELIIVEWNPPEERSRFKDAITWTSMPLRNCAVRIIEVSNSVHRELSNPEKYLLLEYLGQNVGIRRARGRYVLSTNPDIIFGQHLIGYLARVNLEPGCFYRIDRYDVRAPIPLTLATNGILEYCSQNIARVNRYLSSNKNTLFDRIHLRHWIQRVRHLKYSLQNFPASQPHTNGAGDFILMQNEAWQRIRGFPELESKGESHHIDALMVYAAQLSGLRQVVLSEPVRLYHQEHSRPEGDKPASRAVEVLFQQYRKERCLRIVNDESWGLGLKVLPEVCL